MSSLPISTRQWTLAKHPDSLPTYSGNDSNFKLETKDLESLSDGHILVQTIYLSNDPAQRGWISSPEQIEPERLYVPPVNLGEAMRSRGLAKVLASKADGFNEGDIVQGNMGWREYVVLNAKDPAAGVRVVKPLPGGLSLTHYLGALGGTGLTAWYGLVEVAGCKGGEKVVVSGAAGATGSMVVQIAKHIVGAANVIGIAGSDKKCRWVESLGADKCLNYKSKNFATELKDAVKGAGGCDVYFDNVGGEILDLMLGNLSLNGRVAACGAIAAYNGEAPQPMKNYFYVVTMRLQIRGFIVIDFLDRAVEIIGKLVQGIKDGKLKIGEENETVVKAKFEEIPETWLKLFKGGNQGKLVTAIEG